MGLHASLFVCRCPRWVQGLLIRGPKRMEPGEGPPVSSPDPAIIPSVEQPALSSTHVVTDMPSGSPAVPTHTAQLRSPSYSHLELASVFSGNEPSRLYYYLDLDLAIWLVTSSSDKVLHYTASLLGTISICYPWCQTRKRQHHTAVQTPDTPPSTGPTLVDFCLTAVPLSPRALLPLPACYCLPTPSHHTATRCQLATASLRRHIALPLIVQHYR